MFLSKAVTYSSTATDRTNLFKSYIKSSDSDIYLGGAGTGMTGPQEDSNEGKLCLPLKMGVVKGRVRMKMRWRVEGVG